jgi:hypothetical protein
MSSHDVIDLIRGIAWPVVIALLLVTYRKSIGAFLDGLAGSIGSRGGKVSVAQVFSLELNPLPEFSPSWSYPHLSDVRQLSPAFEFQSGSTELFNQIGNAMPADYAVIDLGTGDQWLTSRLFIFADLLERVRGLRCFVFVETAGAIRRRFVGTASPSSVRQALGHRYPWLDQALTQAYAASPRGALSAPGTLDRSFAQQIAQSFLQNVQIDQQPAPLEAGDWLKHENQSLWEHAKWLDGARITRVLGDTLNDAYAPEQVDASPAERTRTVLRREGPFVALVGDDKVFRLLVDRQALLDRVAIRVVETFDEPAEVGP